MLLHLLETGAPPGEKVVDHLDDGVMGARLVSEPLMYPLIQLREIILVALLETIGDKEDGLLPLPLSLPCSL